jgi:transcription elongation factor GreA
MEVPMANEILLTPGGHAKLKAELDDLKGPVRMRIAEAIREAKAHGDLKENAAYHEAKLNQTRLESRIADLEKALQIAKIVERPADAGNTAALGSKVKLLDVEFGDELTVELVGSFEADPATDLISIVSPLGEALLGKSIGDELAIEAPAGTQRYRVLAVSQ